MSALVKDLHEHAMADVINMLCISHFDGDHVNGLLELLKVFTVNRLFLPYLPLNKRLQVVCNLDMDKAGSTDAMLFTLDPAGFLSARGMGDRVLSIVYVRGGEGNGDNPPRNIDDLPIGSSLSDDESREREAIAVTITGGDYMPLLGGGGRVPETDINHRAPITWYKGMWEFVFFNKELPNGLTPKLKADLATIQADVQKVLTKWNLDGVAPQDIEGWQKDLRECYVRHFGGSPKAKNDISLCLLSRQRTKAKLEQCSLFKMPFANLGCAHTLVPVSDVDKSGLLLTGDISIDEKVLDTMSKHFDPLRWQDIHVMQIPHHGSTNSWKEGCAALCFHEYSVFCVPDNDSSGLHPHPTVLKDLEDKRPLFANYSNGVVYCFHTNK